MALSVDPHIVKEALWEIKQHPFLHLFLRIWANRIREQAGVPNQGWKEKLLCSLAFTIRDVDHELVAAEDVQRSSSP